MGAALPVSVTEDVGAARSLAAQRLAMYGQLPSYRAMLDREGYAGPKVAALIGSEETVTERLDELCAAGVDEFGGACRPVYRKGANAREPACAPGNLGRLVRSQARRRFEFVQRRLDAVGQVGDIACDLGCGDKTEVDRSAIVKSR